MSKTLSESIKSLVVRPDNMNHLREEATRGIEAMDTLLEDRKDLLKSLDAYKDLTRRLTIDLEQKNKSLHETKLERDFYIKSNARVTVYLNQLETTMNALKHELRRPLVDEAAQLPARSQPALELKVAG